jgi:predicted lipoprotein with Yx(FWY)xxD motif
MSRWASVASVLVAALVMACSAAGPGATPTSPPTDPPTTPPTASPTTPATASPTAAVTASPTTGASAEPTPCDVSYGDDCGPSGSTPPAQGAVTVSAITYGEIGAYLAGPTRMALYTFDKDSPGSSSCTGDCASAWPPLTLPMGETPTAAPGVTGELGTIMRSDGTHQVTYNDAPLYYYVGDTGLYDVTGDGVGWVWHLARP